MEETITKEFERLSRIAPERLQRERKLPDGTTIRTAGPFIYGYSMTVGPDGKPKVREFGNFKPQTRIGKPQMDVKDKREPLADVINEKDHIRVIVELPGVEKGDIKLSGTEEKLTISVDTADRKYYKELELPEKVDSKKANSTYKNGVLDVTVPKIKNKKTKSQNIKID
jgi:HSP20 family protein